MQVPDFAPFIGIMIGLGVGIDYALLIVTRYREQLHAGHTVRSDEDDDGEGQAEQLGPRLLELGEQVAAGHRPHAVELGAELADALAHLARLGEVDVLGQVDGGDGDRARGLALRGDEALPSRVVRALHHHHRLDGGNLGQQVLDLLAHGRVGDAGLRFEHDRARARRGGAVLELGLEELEALGGLEAREREVLPVGLPHRPGDAVGHDERGDPQCEDQLPPVVAPGP
ncbi:MAG TPA: MMPL family transporter [Acidimicrobiales bacterium]|nr:MMPL family transporter [Acidimicrobiales bacterium]